MQNNISMMQKRQRHFDKIFISFLYVLSRIIENIMTVITVTFEWGRILGLWGYLGIYITIVKCMHEYYYKVANVGIVALGMSYEDR